MDQHLVEQKAYDIGQWLQDAVGDIAYDHWPMDPKWQKKIKKAKARGVVDLKGWLADEYYNDVDTLQDLCGDHIYDAATSICRDTTKPGNPIDRDQHAQCFIAIAESMMENAHTALVQALDNLIKRRQ